MGLFVEDFDKCTQWMGSLETLSAEMGSKCILMASLQRRAKFVGLLMNTGSTTELRGADSEAGVHLV